MPADPRLRSPARRESFNETARFWAATYAGAAATASDANGKDPVALAGLDKSEVDKFTGVRPPCASCSSRCDRGRKS